MLGYEKISQHLTQSLYFSGIAFAHWRSTNGSLIDLSVMHVLLAPRQRAFLLLKHCFSYTVQFAILYVCHTVQFAILYACHTERRR